MSRIVDTLPANFTKLANGRLVVEGDYFAFRGRYVVVTSNSPYYHKLPENLPGDVFRDHGGTGSMVGKKGLRSG